MRCFVLGTFVPNLSELKFIVMSIFTRCWPPGDILFECSRLGVICNYKDERYQE
jgi:hypothetical protein